MVARWRAFALLGAGHENRGGRTLGSEGRWHKRAPAAPGLEGCGEPLLRYLDPGRPVLRLRGSRKYLGASRSAISPATPERARAAHLRAHVVFRCDAEPRRQAPLRRGRPAQGQTGPLRCWYKAVRSVPRRTFG